MFIMGHDVKVLLTCSLAWLVVCWAKMKVGRMSSEVMRGIRKR